MKLLRLAAGATLALVLCLFVIQRTPLKAANTSDADAPSAYAGRWDLTLKAPDHEYPSWLEIRKDGGSLHATFVSRSGNARPLPKCELSNGTLTFVSPKEEEERKDDMVFKGKLVGDQLQGTTTGQDGTPWTWTGVRAPSLKRTHPPKWGKPLSLLNGKDLTGWHMSTPQSTAVWKVVNGTLVSPGHGPEIISDAKFQDFRLHVEFNYDPNSNSGVYLRGRYEVQIESNSAQEPPSHHTGGVYGFFAPTPELPRRPGEWQTFDISLVGRTITVVQNGQKVIDNQDIPGMTGGALDSDEASPGPIYLQGSEDGHVAFRNIKLTPAK